jgi:DNA-binding MarR family transcriptional regulator
MSDGPWLSDSEQCAWRNFLTMQGDLRRRLNRQLLREAGLSEADYGVLVQLTEAPAGRLRVFELRDAAGWEKSRMTHQVTRMVERGLLERQACPEEPRGQFVALTEAGRAAIEKAAPTHVGHVRRWFIDQVTPDELAMLSEMSERVKKRLAEDDPDIPC